MKNKAVIWTVTIILGLPVPISLITTLGSIVSLANIVELLDHSYLLAIGAIFSMLLSGTYSITYVASTLFTFRAKKLSVVSFLPVFHLLVTVMFFVAWISLEKIYL